MITVDAINAIYTTITKLYSDDLDKALDLIGDLMYEIDSVGVGEYKALIRVLDAVERIHIRKSVQFYSNLWKVAEQYRDDEIMYQRNEEAHVADMLSYYRTTLKIKKMGD